MFIVVHVQKILKRKLEKISDEDEEKIKEEVPEPTNMDNDQTEPQSFEVKKIKKSAKGSLVII